MRYNTVEWTVSTAPDVLLRYVLRVAVQPAAVSCALTRVAQCRSTRRAVRQGTGGLPAVSTLHSLQRQLH